MRRNLFTLFLLTLTVGQLYAGGLLTNTNQSVHFLRNPARDASTEIDAVYTNPAGIVKLKEGWHFSINSQSAFQTRTIMANSPLFKGYGGEETKTFKGNASVPVVPSAMVAYRNGDWVIAGHFAISGGGGKATFNHGLPMFEAIAATGSKLIMDNLPQLQGGAMEGATYNPYTVDQYMSGSSMIYGGQIGAAYKINDMLSLYGGVRLNIVNNGYKGYMRGLRVNVSPDLQNPMLIDCKEVFDQILSQAPEELRPALAVLSQSSTAEGAVVNVSQSGWGISPIIGAHFSYKGLDIGVKYEFRTSLNIENKTKRDDTGMYKDGVNTPHDIPGLFTAGVSYDFTNWFNLSLGFHNFFDSEARMDGGKEKLISGGTKEYLGGMEFTLSPTVSLSGGVQFTRQGVSNAYQSDMSFALNSYSIGLGGFVNVTKDIRINAGYFWTTYSNWKDVFEQSTGIMRTFKRTNKVFGVGADFRF